MQQFSCFFVGIFVQFIPNPTGTSRYKSNNFPLSLFKQMLTKHMHFLPRCKISCYICPVSLAVFDILIVAEKFEASY